WLASLVGVDGRVEGQPPPAAFRRASSVRYSNGPSTALSGKARLTRTRTRLRLRDHRSRGVVLIHCDLLDNLFYRGHRLPAHVSACLFGRGLGRVPGLCGRPPPFRTLGEGVHVLFLGE